MQTMGRKASRLGVFVAAVGAAVALTAGGAQSLPMPSASRAVSRVMVKVDGPVRETAERPVDRLASHQDKVDKAAAYAAEFVSTILL
jgi:hypothetical protein